MSKDFFAPLGSESLCFEEGNELHWRGDMEVDKRIHEEPKRPKAPISLICPDTGKVTSHDASDLRAQLEQFRLAQVSSPSHHTSEFQRLKASADGSLVAVDDELRGRDGEWLVVIEATPDKQVLTLLCCDSGTPFRRTASAVHDDVQKGRIKVHRYGMPDIPPDLEEFPQTDGQSCQAS